MPWPMRPSRAPRPDRRPRDPDGRVPRRPRGTRSPACFANDDALAAEVARRLEVGRASATWRLPLDDDFQDLIKSRASPTSRTSAASTGGRSRPPSSSNSSSPRPPLGPPRHRRPSLVRLRRRDPRRRAAPAASSGPWSPWPKPRRESRIAGSGSRSRLDRDRNSQSRDLPSRTVRDDSPRARDRASVKGHQTFQGTVIGFDPTGREGLASTSRRRDSCWLAVVGSDQIRWESRASRRHSIRRLFMSRTSRIRKTSSMSRLSSMAQLRMSRFSWPALSRRMMAAINSES